MTKVSLTIVVLALALTLAGCAARPELPARAAGNPEEVDLAGRWLLRVNPDAPSTRPGESQETLWVPPASSGRRQQAPGRAVRNERSKGPSVHVFMETGKALKITQTEHGLFVSFDRAVVEEYTFGENRVVSVGPIEAQRVAGWEGTIFVVDTMDKRGATLSETWALEAEGLELVRNIRIVDRGKELYTTRQVFDRS